MNSERRTILGLVAAGRISAQEAERLLKLESDAREELWIVAAMLLVCAAQLHLRVSLDGFQHLLEQAIRALLSTWGAVGNAAGALLSKGMGGAI